MPGATLRPASAGDIDAIARIHVENWRSTYAGIIPDSYLVGMDIAGQRRMWRQTLHRSGRGHSVIVAQTVETGVVGFASCGPARRRWLPKRSPYDGEVYTLYVGLDQQGEGHGQRLLEACFGTLRSQEKSAVIVWVLAANPARFFYEAQGGHRVAERIESFAGAELEELAFGWDLSEAG